MDADFMPDALGLKRFRGLSARELNINRVTRKKRAIVRST